MKSYLLLIFTLLCTTSLAAQAGPVAAVTFVHFDKQFYVAGENIWYKVYLPKSVNGLKVVHADLQAPDNRIVLHQQLKVSDQSLASALIRLPFDIAESNYQFRLTALSADGQKATILYQTTIPIYNDLQVKSPVGEKAKSGEQQSASPLNLPLQVSISSDQQSYHQRDLVQLELQVKDERGQAVQANLSLAVVAEGLQRPQAGWATAKTLAVNNMDWEQGLTYYAQIKEAKSGTPTQVNAMAAFLVGLQQNTWCKTDAAGELKITLPDFETDQRLQLQALRLFGNEPHYLAELKPWPWADMPRTSMRTAVVERSAAVEQYSASSQQRKKIKALFGLDTIGLLVSVDTLAQVLQADRSYFPDRYVAFKSLEEFIFEVVLPLRIKRKKNKTRVRLLNENTKLFFEDPPLFMVDNQLTYDAETILALDLSDIARIDLYINNETLNKEFGALGRNGVAAIFTHAGKAKLSEKEQQNIFAIQGFEPVQNFVAPQYPNANLRQSRIPDFRPLLHWEANIQTDETGRATVQFYSSDDYGDFRIQLIGRDAEGQYGMAEKTLIILPEQGN